jgi:hypothetical protein
VKFPNFVGPSYESQALMQMGARTVNMYTEKVGVPGGKSATSLMSCPGLPDFATTSNAGGRGIFAEESGRLFVVMGAGLDEIAANGTVTPRGAVAVDASPAQLAANGKDELLVASGGVGKLLNLLTGAFTTVVTGITFCGVVDTFLIGLDGTTGTMKISEASDGMTWDPGQVQQRSAAADPWIAMIVIDRKIYFFGAKTGEVWANVGASPFPFQLLSGAFFEIGIEAPFSLAPLGSSFAWLGGSERGDGRVYAMSGYTPTPISNEAIEWAIQGYKDAGRIDDAIGWSYDRIGHSFYVLEFPTARKTWVFDGVTQQWHERGLWSPDDNALLAYRPRFQASCFRKNIVLDSQAAKAYYLSENVYTDVGGRTLLRMRRLPHYSNENKNFNLDYVELECQRGVGLTQGQGADPLVTLAVSWDGGATYGNDRTASLGKKGEYAQRVRWDRCGQGSDLVMALTCSDPVAARWFDLYGGIS